MGAACRKEKREPTSAAAAGSAAAISTATAGGPGRCGVFWDIENVPVPKGADAALVAGALFALARSFGDVVRFNSHGNTAAIPVRRRHDLQAAGVTMVDVAPGRKEAADKSILVDMLLFAGGYVAMRG
jgi:hypothetical protein